MNLQSYLTLYRDGLLQDTLPFWIRHGIDQEHGGILTALDRDGSVLDTDKSVWHQGRSTWLFAKLYNTVEPREEWLSLADNGLRFLKDHCFDPADGRMWFQVTREGQPLRKRRYAFSESFAAIAFGQYAKATGNGEAADRARLLFQTFRDHHHQVGRMASKFTDTRPSRSLAVPMITLVTAQELRESIQLSEADAIIDQTITILKRDFIRPELKCVLENVGPGGEVLDHFDGRLLNPGHAIECAWFLMAEGRHRRDRELQTLGCEMLDWMWDRGWDTEHGGLYYFRDLYGKPVTEYWHDMKFWWPHNEAILATLLAYLITGDSVRRERHRLVHDWAYRHFPDPEHGEWFGYLHRDGRLSVPLKGNLWKGPFHLPRMQLYGWQWLAAEQR